MKQLRILLTLILITSCFTGINSFGKSTGPISVNKATQKQTAAILSAVYRWTVYLHQKKLNEAMGLYTEDAVFYSPDGHNAVGKKQVRALFVQVFKMFDSNITMVSKSLTVSNGIAYSGGDYTETLVDRKSHKKMDLHGSYLMVFKLSAEGQWRIAQNMWTNAAPAGK